MNVGGEVPDQDVRHACKMLSQPTRARAGGRGLCVPKTRNSANTPAGGRHLDRIERPVVPWLIADRTFVSWLESHRPPRRAPPSARARARQPGADRGGGLVTRVVADDAEAATLAEALVAGATGALGAAKRLLNAGWAERLDPQVASESRASVDAAGRPSGGRASLRSCRSASRSSGTPDRCRREPRSCAHRSPAGAANGDRAGAACRQRVTRTSIDSMCPMRSRRFRRIGL